MRRLLALRRGLPGRLHPRRRGREHAGEPRVGGRALGNEFELAEYNRDDQIYTKDMLLAPPVKHVPVADAVLYDTPIPFYRSDS